jgi:hypothetical protein
MFIKNSPVRIATGLSIICLLHIPLVSAEPVTLDDSSLNQVTAGTDVNAPGGSGGAIIGNSSEATISQTGGVDLSGEAQSGANALNLVNTAESTVANGVNIWDVNSADTSSVDNSEMAVDQSNVISQEQRRSASMPNYSRPEANTFVQLDRTGTESHNDSINRNNNIVDLHVLSSDAKNASWSSVDTTIAGGGKTNADPTIANPLPASPEASVDTNVGKGLAIAGQLDATIDGGEVQIGLAVGGAVIAHPDVITPTTGGTPVDTYGGMDVGNADSDFTLYGRLILPELTLTINGSGCGVVMGSCDAGGTADLTSSETIDQSIMDTDVSSSVGNSEFTENMTETYRSPFELNNAQAEYIVVDDSSLTVNTTFNLVLAGSAQSNVRAMNVVNATGSAVADGINIARTSGLTNGGAMALQQSNVISHSR